ncbi:MAG: Smr/MutS family protein [Pseudomonadota bacterium]|nr:Smr/MutS family protein [Pseudomonadota bacterium]
MNKKIPKTQQSTDVSDEALFLATMSSVKPIHNPKKDKNSTLKAAAPSPRTLVGDRKKLSNNLTTPALRAGVAINLDRRSMDRLRKGKVRPTAQLDLHGLTVEKAHGAFNNIIQRAYAEGKRCILVITGKGLTKRGAGIIRRELPQWINAAENRGLILGFSPAQPQDGGEGAFYLLIKRKK